MALVITVLEGLAAGQRLDLEGMQAVRIGRAPANDLVIEDGAVSRFHCVLKRSGDRWIAADLGGVNGTVVNGKRIKEHALTAGDRIRIGRSVIQFGTGRQETPTPSPGLKPVDKAKPVKLAEPMEAAEPAERALHAETPAPSVVPTAADDLPELPETDEDVSAESASAGEQGTMMLQLEDEEKAEDPPLPPPRKPPPPPPPVKGHAAQAAPVQEPSAPQAAAPAAQSAPSQCPKCGQALPAVVVICVQCGFNLRTGATVQTVAPKTHPRPRGSILVIPPKTVAAVVILGALAAAWFFVGAPFLVKMKVQASFSHVRAGNLAEALDQFAGLETKAGPEDRQKLALWAKQVRLEMAKNEGDVMSEGQPVRSEAVEMSVDKEKNKFASDGALLVYTTVKNKGQRPLTLSRDFFYLRGLKDIVVVANHTGNTMDGVALAPGESKDVIVAFRKVPDIPVRIPDAKGGGTRYYMFFNDGESYVKCWLPF